MRVFWTVIGALLLLSAPPRADEPPKQSSKDEPKKEGKTYQIPYRLTNTKHVLVRAKINGKGPYNFIIDTGAPALFVATAVCKKLDIEPDKKGWGTFDKFEIEGGLVIEKAKGRIEDPFQLEGMNSLGLAGVELHGVIGYNLLAKYKMEFDFTKTKLAWTELVDFEPKPPEGLTKGGGGVDAMAVLMKVLVAFLGDRPKPELTPRGFLGLELEDGKDGIVVKGVLEKSPAAAAGIKAGDRITHYSAWEVPKIEDLQKRLANRGADEEVTLKIKRGDDKKEFKLKTAEGL
jgi:serine protease DegQ